MTESEDYRMYLNSRFDDLTHLMNAQFTAVNDRLDKIETQTTKTNGRVTCLELEQAKEKGKDETKSNSFEKWIKIAALVVSIIIAFYTINSKMNRIESKVDWASSPVNMRGGHINDTIKWN